MNCGITILITVPSLAGVIPRSEAKIACSMSSKVDLSYGVTIKTRASGILTLDICVSGVGTP